MGCKVPPNLWYPGGMTAPELTITTEQVNSLPLLLGLIIDMGVRELIDTQIHPHGNWEGASVGTVLSIWLSHILQERDHTMVSVRDWAMERVQTLNTLLATTLRDTDCTDDRLARLLTLLGEQDTQAALDRALLQRWIRVYRLPTETLRLDSTSVSVYHDEGDDDSLLQHGWSKDHRPDLRQFKLMLATLDPLGLPICCQPIAGNRSDNPLYFPAYDAAVAGHRGCAGGGRQQDDCPAHSGPYRRGRESLPGRLSPHPRHSRDQQLGRASAGAPSSVGAARKRRSAHRRVDPGRGGRPLRAA